MALLVAQAAETTVARRRAARAAESARRRIGNHFGTTGNTKGEHLIGRSHVFLQVRERDGRPAALSVESHYTPQGQGRLIDDQYERIVVALRNLRHQFDRAALRREALRDVGVFRGEVPRQIALARKEEDRRAGAIAFWDPAYDYLIVSRHIRVHFDAVRDEQLLFWGQVFPSHLARLFDQDTPAFGQLLVQHAALVRVDEVGREVFDGIVLELKRLRQLSGRKLSRIDLRRKGCDNKRRHYKSPQTCC